MALHDSVSIRTSLRGRKKGIGSAGRLVTSTRSSTTTNFVRTPMNCERHGGGELGYPVRSKSRARASQVLLNGKRDIGEGSWFLQGARFGSRASKSREDRDLAAGIKVGEREVLLTSGPQLSMTQGVGSTRQGKNGEGKGNVYPHDWPGLRPRAGPRWR